MNWEQLLGKESLQSIDPASSALHLVLAIVLGQLLAWHYLRYAQVLSNKRKFARMFVFIAATTFLMITVVKQSLALSLGLVGALSIIRFRTPIKEPEELAYLFMAIAVGVGLGATQAVATVGVFVVVLLYLAVRGTAGGMVVPLRTILQVTAPLRDPQQDASGSGELEALVPAVEGPCSKVDLRRVDCHDGALHASLIIEVDSVGSVANVMRSVQAALPGAEVSVIERDSIE